MVEERDTRFNAFINRNPSHNEAVFLLLQSLLNTMTEEESNSCMDQGHRVLKQVVGKIPKTLPGHKAIELIKKIDEALGEDTQWSNRN
ncbi:hypothetical protein B9Z55_004833 [Caenorhabditis nigoni]|uniref:Uncharacterized protein n=1 Tax=Caenorhabditis nigoni TaxID=1611254 RepID=A0A2G5UY93_9PELO|nr:hypothetical protein B9Z55_004833 [Caenorhabditis nigoni]